MLSCISLRRLAPVLMALGIGAIGCASDPLPEDEATADVGSELVLPGGLINANFVAGGLGVVAAPAAVGMPAVGGMGTIGTTATVNGAPIGLGTNIGTGPISVGTSFNSGPMGFSTGPQGFSTSFGTGPITTGGSMSISSSNGAMPVIHSTCLGMACP